ncbi:MAG: hypothetical protein MI922_01480, partial [Bacteroidales bacterium]|nr:hypothetical protein [Bacteroidales bacterium]
MEHPAVVIVSDGTTPLMDVAKGQILHPDWVDVNIPWDQGWADLLEAVGYNVCRNDGTWANGLTDENKALLEAADLVIMSRDTGKGTIGNYADDWNPIATPLIALNPWPLGTVNDKKLLRWFPGKDGGHGAPMMVSADPNIGTIDFIDVNVGAGITSFATVPDVGNGELLASIEPGFLDIAGIELGDSAWIIKWEAGVEFFPDVNQYAGDVRIYMAAGTKPCSTTGVPSSISYGLAKPAGKTWPQKFAKA